MKWFGSRGCVVTIVASLLLLRGIMGMNAMQSKADATIIGYPDANLGRWIQQITHVRLYTPPSSPPSFYTGAIGADGCLVHLSVFRAEEWKKKWNQHITAAQCTQAEETSGIHYPNNLPGQLMKIGGLSRTNQDDWVWLNPGGFLRWYMSFFFNKPTQPNQYHDTPDASFEGMLTDDSRKENIVWEFSVALLDGVLIPDIVVVTSLGKVYGVYDPMFASDDREAPVIIDLDLPQYPTSWLSISWAGDMNGDGHHDLVIGNPEMNYGKQGEVYIFYGPFPQPGTGHPEPQTREDADVIIHGPSSWLHSREEFGAAVAGVGDVDGDGFADVLIGAPKSTMGGHESGAVYLIRGGPNMPAERRL